ncbi:hypothetical protein [Afifella pfennigii]|uniref:hypothetical protein n=1 Tax=Afifella pfennigii TaxID=209897 RepID=UPI00068A9506|nr:hypothetical protein [Afifella pfennigii]
MSDLRAMIREVLAEELERLGGGAGAARPEPRQEVVTLRTNQNLAAFVSRLLRLAEDDKLRADIAAGRYVFRLGPGGAPPLEAHRPAAPSPSAAPSAVRFERGLVTERDVARLPEGLRSVSAAKGVRFTPLAGDELRRRGIKIERAST